MSLPDLMDQLARWYTDDPAKCEDFCLKMADGNTYLLDAVRAKAEALTI